MSNGAHINWDHAWMAENWRSLSDEELAINQKSNAFAVQKYRLIKGWRRKPTPGTVNWDDAWMETNWQAFSDVEIAAKMNTCVVTVKGYRLRRGWKRPEQKYNGGPRSAKHIQAAIDAAMVRGIELCIGRKLVGSRYQMRITATMPTAQGKLLKSEPRLLAVVSALPRMLIEISEEFERMKRRAAA